MRKRSGRIYEHKRTGKWGTAYPEDQTKETMEKKELLVEGFDGNKYVWKIDELIIRGYAD